MKDEALEMLPDTRQSLLIKKIRLVILIFIIGLAISGITALPLESELEALHHIVVKGEIDNSLARWIEHVYTGLRETNSKFPFIAYGTDWLAFAHLMIAIVFVGPLRDPVKNIWVVEFGLLACLFIFPFAFIAGAVRGIPLYWRLIDCSFGLIGGLLLWKCYRLIKELDYTQQTLL